MDLNLFEWIAKILRESGPQFLRGTGMTVFLAVIGTGIGFVIGLIIGVIRTIPKNPSGKGGATPRSVILSAVNAVMAVYVEVFRGTPMMVQAVLIFYALAETGIIEFGSLAAGIIVITLNTGAYMAEIVRGGIHSIDRGQGEAAKAIGMNHWKTMLFVVLPQTVRNILPATGNEFIMNLKDSSVLNLIMVGELFYTAKIIRGIYYVYYPPFLIAAAIYLFLTFVSSRLLRILEAHIDGPKDYTLVGAESLHTMPTDGFREGG